MADDIMIVPCNEAYYDAAVRIFNESFLPKFNGIHKDPAVRSDFTHDFGLIKTKDNDSDYVAVQDGKVLGILLVSYDGIQKHLPTITSGEMFRKYGIMGMIRSMILDMVVTYKPKPDELYIDSVAVSSDARGLGLGTKMLEFAEKTAEERGLKKLVLQVMYENPRAKKLYERFGFSEFSHLESRWLKRKTGFTGAYKMQKVL